MMTFCPSCGVTVPAHAESTAGKQLWRCGSCSTLLKEEPLGSPSAAAGRGDPVLGRIAIARVTPAEALAARAEAEARAAAQAQARAAAAAAAAAARKAAATPPDPAPGSRPDAIELPEDDGEFVLESAGCERAIDVGAAAPAPALAPPAPSGSKPKPRPEPVDPGTARPTLFEHILLAEAGEPLRDQLSLALVQSGTAGDVTACATGAHFLQAATAELSRHGALPLAVLDAELPLLTGVQLAVALRAVERGLGAPPTPLLFFTLHPCDAVLQRVMEHCQPARYLAKGEGGPQQVAARLVQVLASLRR